MNLAKLKKDQLLWLVHNKCRHGVQYIQHPNCYDREHPGCLPGGTPEKIGFLDIEATNLAADFGYCFSYAIKDLNGKVHGRVLRSSEIRSYTFDKNLMKELCADIKRYDRLVVHYGTDRRFDIPFVRTRCLYHDIEFPEFGSISADDTFAMSRNKLKLSRNRLENIAVFFDIPAKGHKMQPAMWQKALAGHEPSLQYIWKHNIEDVESLEAVWKKLHPYVAKRKSSL